MHKRVAIELLPLNLEIEKTLRGLRRIRREEQDIMKDRTPIAPIRHEDIHVRDQFIQEDARLLG